MKIRLLPPPSDGDARQRAALAELRRRGFQTRVRSGPGATGYVVEVDDEDAAKLIREGLAEAVPPPVESAPKKKTR